MAAGDDKKTGRVNNDIYDHLGERWSRRGNRDVVFLTKRAPG